MPSRYKGNLLRPTESNDSYGIVPIDDTKTITFPFPSQAVFTTPGYHSWTVPKNVNKVSAVAVGGGGGGCGTNSGGAGGAGGALSHVYDLDVTPGTTVDIFVGAGGPRSGVNLSKGLWGGDSWVGSTKAGYGISIQPNTATISAVPYSAPVFAKSGLRVDHPINYDIYTASLNSAYSLEPVYSAYDASSFHISAISRDLADSDQMSYPYGIFIDSTGTHMYITERQNKYISQYRLQTPFATSSARKVGQFFTDGIDNNPSSVYFKPDGTQMYIVGQQNDKIYYFNLSTAWDITTATQVVSYAYIVGSQENFPYAMTFNSDGTKMYVIGTGSDAVVEYSLSTAYRPSTATHTASTSVATNAINPVYLEFNSDGTKLIVFSFSNQGFTEYSLSTAYDSTTISYVSASPAHSHGFNASYGACIADNGKRGYLTDTTRDRIYEGYFGTSPTKRTHTLPPYIRNNDSAINGIQYANSGDSLYLSLGTRINQIGLDNYNLDAMSYENTGPVMRDLRGFDFNGDGTELYAANAIDNTIDKHICSRGYALKNEDGNQDSFNAMAFADNGAKLYVLDNVTDDVIQHTLSTAYDLSTASPTKHDPFSSIQPESLAITKHLFIGTGTDGSVTLPRGIEFKPDGTLLFVLDDTTDSIVEYVLSTAWDITTATYSQSLNITAQVSSAQEVRFKSDGTKMFVMDITTDSVYEYALSTAWDISSASYTQSKSVSAQDATPYTLDFKTDGTKMYIGGLTADDIFEYDLSTAWDISTATYNSVSYDLGGGAGITNPFSIKFKSDGTAFLLSNNSTLFLHTLSTAWDLSTASYTGEYSGFLDSSQLVGIAINETTNQIFCADYGEDLVKEFYVENKISLTGTEGTGYGLYVKDDGSSFYVTGNDSDAVNQFDMSTPHDLTTATSSGSVSYYANSIRDLTFKPDGTKMYLTDVTTDVILSYDLSTAWDVTTATFTPADDASNSQFFSGISINASTGETVPRGVYLKDDGTKFYVVGAGTDSVHEFTMSTAFNATTATLTDSFSLATEHGTNPYAVTFKPDGTKMYTTGYATGEIAEYDLSTAWDLTTAAVNQTLSVSSETGTPYTVQFKTDGTKMYVGGNNYLAEYNLSTAWDISTATVNQSTTDIFINYGLSFNENGTVLSTFRSNATLYTYTLSTAWDISTLNSDPKITIVPSLTGGLGLYVLPDLSHIITSDNTGDIVDILKVINAYSTSAKDGPYESVPQGITFTSDGLHAYFCGTGEDSITHIGLSTAWDISTATPYVPTTSPGTENLAVVKKGNSFSFSGTEANPAGLFFKPDGTEMYLAGYSGDNFYQYSLSTAWDITTASLTTTFDVSSQQGVPYLNHMSPDGKHIYATNAGGVNVYHYTLSTAWDLSTASYDQAFDFSAEGETNIFAITLKPDGTKAYIIGGTLDKVQEFDLSTAYDLSTATFVATSTLNFLGTVVSLIFTADGKYLYAADQGSDGINIYELTTAWDITTAVNWNSRLYFSGNLTGLFIDPNDDAMYVVSNSTDDVVKYDFADGLSYTYIPSVDLRSLHVKPDGSSIFFVEAGKKTIYELELNTATELSTHTIPTVPYYIGGLFYTKGYSLGGYTPEGSVALSPDGRMLYFTVDVNTDNPWIYGYRTSDNDPYNYDTLSPYSRYEYYQSISFGNNGNTALLGNEENNYFSANAHSCNNYKFIPFVAEGGQGGGDGGTPTLGRNGGKYYGSGGGNGGNSQNAINTSTGGGGGGAGGYSGDGGLGSNSYNQNGFAGSGGGGGGGGAGYTGTGGGGGGVGILGEGTSGGIAPYLGSSFNYANPGQGGSGGADADAGATSGGRDTFGGNYGGGGAGSDGYTSYQGDGAQGAVRIIWGSGRKYPSTNVADQ